MYIIILYILILCSLSLYKFTLSYTLILPNKKNNEIQI